MPKLRLIGPFPPPFGGVALHLVRLTEQYRRSGIDVRGISLGGIPRGLDGIRKLNALHFFGRIPVHYHTDEGNFKWMLLFSAWWRLMRVPYAVTVHSFRFKEEFELVRIQDRLRTAFNGAHAIIAISDDVREDLFKRIGVDRTRIHVVSSALPLSEWEHKESTAGYIPPEWLQANVRILANAGRVVKYDGKDLYGLDLLASAMNNISDSDAHCLIVIGDVVDADVLAEVHRIAGDSNRIHLVRHYAGTLAPVVAHSHIVVRPTRTEGGESLTLAEAIELGRWAIGSDAVARPEHTVVFRNEDVSDLTNVLQECIRHVRINEFPAPYIPSDERVQRIITLVLGI